jgi:hypothetical protein
MLVSFSLAIMSSLTPRSRVSLPWTVVSLKQFELNFAQGGRTMSQALQVLFKPHSPLTLRL